MILVTESQKRNQCRDQLIALGTSVPTSFHDPLAMGAFRSFDNRSSWMEETEIALSAGRRVVLSGDFSDFSDVVDQVRKLCGQGSDRRIALLIHWTQARHLQPSSIDVEAFDSIFVLVDEEISLEASRLIYHRWTPQWVLQPRAGLSWKGLIEKLFESQRSGSLTIFSPDHRDKSLEREYFSPDELSLQIQELGLEHPLIKIAPAPHEWFTALEVGPWNFLRRNAKTCSVSTFDRRNGRLNSSLDRSVLPQTSFIVPFFWNGEDRRLGELCAAIQSSKNLATEFVVVVDRKPSAVPLAVSDLELDVDRLILVDAPRPDSEQDWRAGFIRNLGAKYARRESEFFVFLDADIYIRSENYIRSWFSSSSGDILVAQDPGSLKRKSRTTQVGKFQLASSRLLVVKREIFENIGGFAEAFSSYGCEDSFFIWSAEQSSATVDFLPDTEIHHSRSVTAEDRIDAKMNRISKAARLMYRMTLDANVHAHFFTALDGGLWWRAGLRRTLQWNMGRVLLAPLLFFMTLVETDDRAKYLRGLLDIVSWKLKRPLLWTKHHGWRLPHAFHLMMIKVRAHDFGWSIVGWRLKTLGLRTWGQIGRIGGRIHEGFGRAHEALGHAHGYFIRQMHKANRLRIAIHGRLVQLGWRLYRYFCIFLGQLRRLGGEFLRFIGEIKRLIGWLWKLWVIWIQEPVKYLAMRPWHFYRRYHWFLPTYFTLAKNRLIRTFRRDGTKSPRSREESQ